MQGFRAADLPWSARSSAWGAGGVGTAGATIGPIRPGTPRSSRIPGGNPCERVVLRTFVKPHKRAEPSVPGRQTRGGHEPNVRASTTVTRDNREQAPSQPLVTQGP